MNDKHLKETSHHHHKTDLTAVLQHTKGAYRPHA